MVYTDIDGQLREFNRNVVKELSKISDQCDLNYFSEAVDMILTAEKENKRLHITGIGKPHHVSAYAASLFSSTGTPCYLLDGTEATHGSSGQVLHGDVVICISYYGDVPELNKTVTTLKQNGARIISVTGFPDSFIARQGDIHLNVHIEKEGDYLNKPPRTSMLATLFVLMQLSLILQCIKGITPESYVKWHPSGKLGIIEDRK